MSSIAIRTADKQKRSNFKNKEYIILYNKALHRDSILPVHITQSYFNSYGCLSKNTYAVRSINRCVLTGRSRGNLKLFKATRMMFKNLATSGLIPGVKKASW